MHEASHHPLVSAGGPVSDRRREDLARLFREEAAGLERFLSRRTADRGLAEDLTAETFARAARAWTGYDERRASARTWLYAIALNCVHAHARRAGAERRALAQLALIAEPAEIAVVEAIERRLDLQRLVAELSEEERHALLLRYGRDLPMRDIAAITETSLTTADGRVHRALRKLRAAAWADADHAADGNGNGNGHSAPAWTSSRKPPPSPAVDRS